MANQFEYSNTVYDQVVLPQLQEFNPSRKTRESNNPVLQAGFTPHTRARSGERHLNYIQVEIKKRPVKNETQTSEFTQVYQPNNPVATETGESEVFDSHEVVRKCRTLGHTQLTKRRSSVLNIAQQFENRSADMPKSRSLNRIARSDTNRTSVREMAQLYDTMAQDNCQDQLSEGQQRAGSLTRSTSYFRKKALERTVTDYINLTPVCSGAPSARESPQLYMNVAPFSPSKTSPSCYENWTQIEPPSDSLLPHKSAEPYEEVFLGKIQKIPETGEIVQSKSHFSFSMDVLGSPVSQSSSLDGISKHDTDLIRSADLLELPIQSATFYKPRAETIATPGNEECSIALGQFSLNYHSTEPADTYGNFANKAVKSKRYTSGTEVVMSVFRTHVALSSGADVNLPLNLMLMDILMFQCEPQDSGHLTLVVRTGNEFQSLLFSSQSGAIEDVVKCLREAVSEDQLSSSLQSSSSEEFFALLLGCVPVSSATGKVSRGVEQTLATHQLSQAIQVRIEVRDGFQIYPFGRSQSLCSYRHDQVKAVAVWERDPRVLGVVANLRPGKQICYTLRFNRTNQLQAAFSAMRHFCRGETPEDPKKKNAWYMNLISKRKVKSHSNSDSSRPSTPTVDQIDPDTFTLLYLGSTEPDNSNFTSECIQQEYSNLLEGRNVSEIMAPSPTVILNVSDNSLRLTEREKIHFIKRVYQRRMVVTCQCATSGDNILGLVTQRPGTNELKCSIFRSLYSEAGQVAQHVTNKLQLNES